MKKISVIATIGLSVLLFLISLTLPAFYMPVGDIMTEGSLPGIFVLLNGWTGVLVIDQVGFGVLGWFANLFLLTAWLGLALAKSRRVRIGGLILIIVGLGIALCSLFLNHLTINNGVHIENIPITSMGTGFYVWLASISMCLVGYIFIIATEAANAKKNGTV